MTSVAISEESPKGRASSAPEAMPWMAMSRMARFTDCGMMPCSWFQAVCFVRRRAVSSSAAFIEAVTVSA